MALKSVLANLGFLLQISGILMLLPIILAFYFNETIACISLLTTGMNMLSLGFLLNSLAEKRRLDLKSSCALVTIVFILVGIIGSIPYIYEGIFSETNLFSNFTDSFFESISGFTTTGFSLIPNPATLPKSIQFYRALTELIGGIGIIFILLAFFYPSRDLIKVSDVLGIEKTNKDLRKTYVSILVIYLAYIGIFTTAFYFLGFQDVFDTLNSVIHLITTGYSPLNFERYLVYPNSLLVLALILISSINFSVHYKLFTLNFKKLLDKEDIFYIALIVVGALIFMILGNTGIFDSVFHVVSMTSSAGYHYIPFDRISEALLLFLILLMFIGGTRYSMAGGIKIFRFFVILKSILIKIKLKLGMKLSNEEKKLTHVIMMKNLLSVFLSALLVFSFVIIFCLQGLPYIASLFEVTSAFSTTGETLGFVTPSLALDLKWLLIFLMIIGRVEVIPFIVVFLPEKIKVEKLV